MRWWSREPASARMGKLGVPDEREEKREEIALLILYWSLAWPTVKKSGVSSLKIRPFWTFSRLCADNGTERGVWSCQHRVGRTHHGLLQVCWVRLHTTFKSYLGIVSRGEGRVPGWKIEWWVDEGDD